MRNVFVHSNLRLQVLTCSRLFYAALARYNSGMKNPGWQPGEPAQRRQRIDRQYTVVSKVCKVTKRAAPAQVGAFAFRRKTKEQK